MTSIEAYELFLTKANKGDTNSGVSILTSRFIILYNVEKDKWAKERFKTASKDVTIDRIRELFELDEELKTFSLKDEYIQYDLPKNFGKFESSYSLVDTDCCKNIKIFNYEPKIGNLFNIREDDIHQPDFEHQEAPCVLSQNALKIFIGKDYKITKTFMSYHRFPIEIDIQGYEKEDGTPSTTINPDLNNDNINEIVDRIVKEVKGEEQDPEGLNIANEKVNENKN